MRFAPVAAPRLHHRVVHAPFADSLALFHLDTCRLHVLNGSAAAIWEELHAADTIGDLTVRLGDRFGVDPGSIRRDVESTIEQLRGDGLLKVDDQFVPPPRLRTSPEQPPFQTDEAAPVFAALDARVVVRCDDAEMADAIAEILAPLATEDAPTVEIAITAEGEDLWVLQVGDNEPVRMVSRLSLVLRAVGEVNNLAVSSVPDHLVFHAGAVALDGQGVLLPAASNHGKSTLTTALVRSGSSYLTDEAAAIGPDGRIRPFAKAIALEPGSFPLFDDLGPGENIAGLARAVTCREWHVDPARLGDVAPPTPIQVIVCPHWRAGASTRVTRLESCEALHLLLGESFDFTERGDVVFERLVSLVDELPVYRLGYGQLDEAVARCARSSPADQSLGSRRRCRRSCS